jgi:hypothetical protein
MITPHKAIVVVQLIVVSEQVASLVLRVEPVIKIVSAPVVALGSRIPEIYVVAEHTMKFLTLFLITSLTVLADKIPLF